MPISLILLTLATAAALQHHAIETTAAARQLALGRIDMIARVGGCRQALGRAHVDLDRIRVELRRIRFYNAEGPEGRLKFSQVVGRPASPDEELRELARVVPADAFVLGYESGARYIRTTNVVLGHGYFEQPDAEHGTRLTTEEEKKALLLHEVLHIALNVDDDDLTRRDLCPLRLLAFCPRVPAAAPPGGIGSRANGIPAADSGRHQR